MVPHRIVVGVDGSEESRQAARWAAARAQETGSEVILVHALGPDAQFWNDLPPLGFSNWRARVRTRLRKEWSAPVREAHVPFRSMVIDADPVQALSAVAKAERADVIAVGAPSKGHLTDRVIGSFTQRLLHRSHHPVTIVPKDWAELEEAATASVGAEPALG